MYIEQEGNEFVVLNQSGHVVATRRTEREAIRYINEQKKNRKNKNNRREERITYSSRSDDE